MRYTHSTNIDCPVCDTEIKVTGKISSYPATRETPPEWEVEEVDITECPNCGGDITETAFDAVADTDTGPDFDDPYDGPDTIEEAEYDRDYDFETFETEDSL